MRNVNYEVPEKQYRYRFESHEMNCNYTFTQAERTNRMSTYFNEVNASVILRKGEGRTLKAGGAWVYDNEIDKIEGEFTNGDLVVFLYLTT